VSLNTIRYPTLVLPIRNSNNDESWFCVLECRSVFHLMTWYRSHLAQVKQCCIILFALVISRNVSLSLRMGGCPTRVKRVDDAAPRQAERPYRKVFQRAVRRVAFLLRVRRQWSAALRGGDNYLDAEVLVKRHREIFKHVKRVNGKLVYKKS
jgi:hypothetical protein